ncbi:MAG TPA: HlyD family efflux transporter periplasmic adaptor subunit [Anaerolineales bacterium]|nr:HlyD family efflux transporter periplasmic adaptor subunit [Anaerolineales bacterium]
MQNRRPPLPAILLLLVIIALGAYYGIRSLNNTENGQLTASGTIESVVVNVSPEIAGKVQEVLVTESQSVKSGDPLLSIDDGLLVAQRAVASAQLDSAKAALNTAQAAYATAQQQYDATLTNALASEKATRITIWKDTKPTEFDLPVWYFSKEERTQAAETAVDSASKALEDARSKLTDRENKAGSAQFLTYESQLAQARLAFQSAQDVLDATTGASDGQTLRDAAQVILDEAKIDLDDAQKNYNDALSTDGAKDVLEARADVIVAQEIYDTAVDNLHALQTGADSMQVITANKTVDQAKAALDQAQTAVNTAQANLDLLDTQMKKSTIYAPMDGAILTRNVEPGEFVQPGAVALTMANLNELTITVYVPEDQYGKITLGQKATVTVDSFAGETFNAEVVHIADQAEFTPRNVQTVEGRSATVYAIKLKVTDLEGKLKIGMPADVVFK